jgi:hypothetical protein
VGVRVRLFSALMIAALYGAGVVAGAQEAATPEATAQPVLVELFTSEGCSSCPPADQLLQKLDGRRTDAGQVIVALSEHVTYWNQDGWTDPFSDEDFTARQKNYTDRFHVESGPYTPQVVVNGQQQMLGSDPRAILQAVHAQKTTAADSLHLVKAVTMPGAVEVTFLVTSPLPKGTALYAVVADDTDTSTVARGENKGKTLTHVSVARSITRLGGFKVGEPKTVKLHATKREGAGAQVGQHVVLFAQADGQGSVLSVVSAVVGGDFPQTEGLAQAGTQVH